MLRARARRSGACPGSWSACYHEEAKASAVALALHKRVVLVYDEAIPNPDGLRRKVAYVWIKGSGTDLGYQQIVRGRTRVARRPFTRRDTYLDAERRARTQPHTLWRDCQH